MHHDYTVDLKLGMILFVNGDVMVYDGSNNLYLISYVVLLSVAAIVCCLLFECGGNHLL